MCHFGPFAPFGRTLQLNIGVLVFIVDLLLDFLFDIAEYFYLPLIRASYSLLFYSHGLKQTLRKQMLSHNVTLPLLENKTNYYANKTLINPKLMRLPVGSQFSLTIKESTRNFRVHERSCGFSSPVSLLKELVRRKVRWKRKYSQRTRPYALQGRILQILFSLVQNKIRNLQSNKKIEE